MMIFLKDLRKENVAKHQYIWLLMKKGKITKHIVNGYLAYDDVEYENYKRNAKIGRPLKEININE